MDSVVTECLISDLKTIDHGSHHHNMDSVRHPCKSNESVFTLSRLFTTKEGSSCDGQSSGLV